MRHIYNDVLDNITDLRKKFGDRCVLRALHFIYENKRVQKEVSALKAGNIRAFLDDVKASGNSSFKYLQNVYSNQDIKNQNVSLALFVSEMFWDKMVYAGYMEEVLLEPYRRLLRMDMWRITNTKWIKYLVKILVKT